MLFVDDDANILQGYKRMLRNDFEIYTALGGEEAIEVITNEGDFAVIVSDMRMPEMDGVEFLAIAKELAPESVRVMLTGDSGQQTAMDAVNEGMVFRFLTKPCNNELIVKVLNAAVEQYLLITAEKQLLEETLSQSLEVMVDILAMVNPVAFSRATRIKQLVQEVAVSMGIKNLWEIEIAAMLSQVGCVTVPEKILNKIANCEPLSSDELNLYYQHPQIAYNLIARIPRMKYVAEIIAHQNFRLSDYDNSTHFIGTNTMKCAQILKVVLDFDKLLSLGNSPHSAHRKITKFVGWYDKEILEVIGRLIDEKVEEYTTEKISVEDLKFGMVIAEHLWYTDGTDTIEKGQKINLFSMMRLKSYADKGYISRNISVKIPIKRDFEDSFCLIAGESKSLTPQYARNY